MVKQSQLLLQPTEVELRLHVGVEFENIETAPPLPHVLQWFLNVPSWINIFSFPQPLDVVPVIFMFIF